MIEENKRWKGGRAHLFRSLFIKLKLNINASFVAPNKRPPKPTGVTG